MGTPTFPMNGWICPKCGQRSHDIWQVMEQRRSRLHLQRVVPPEPIKTVFGTCGHDASSTMSVTPT